MCGLNWALGMDFTALGHWFDDTFLASSWLIDDDSQAHVAIPKWMELLSRQLNESCDAISK